MVNPIVLAVAVAAAPPPFLEGPTVEGVHEYSLPNGFKVLMLEDPSASTVTVNVTVLVGSRHEGYGEKGMAHLLEHMLFKGTPSHKDIKKEISEHSSRFNATTSDDRTNYFETMAASDANLEWGIRFEADRLVNSFVAKKDLDTEMTVVRNEFERAENSPMFALRSRVHGAALQWHNYGRVVIGIRADIERVPVENLKNFYARYYQPDNAVLVLSGKFDRAKAFKLINDTFGKLPRPSRKLNDTFTSEPTQDGERAVTVRRVGGAPALLASWRAPAVSDPDYPALLVLQGVVGDRPQGRLHQLLVEGKEGLKQKASSVSCSLDQHREPSLFDCFAMFKEGDATTGVRDAMLTALETPKALTDAEVTRARDGWLSQWEQDLADSDRVGFLLSEWSARGDWRLLYLLRDRLKDVKTADVQRVWAKYLKPQNRTFGEYVPTATPDRAEIADASDAHALLANYKGGEAVQQGEAFDVSPTNIDARTKRVTLPNGGKLALLPKKTRAQIVKLVFELKLGTADALKGQQATSLLTASLTGRGTKNLSYKELRTKLESLKSNLVVGGRGQSVSVFVTTQRAQLDEVLGLFIDTIKTPALDAKEFDVLRGELSSRLDARKSDPTTLGNLELARALSPLPPDHINAVLPIEDQLKDLRGVTVEQVKAFHSKFYGAQSGTIAVVGDFDAAAVEQKLTAAFGTWTAAEKYELAADPYVASKADVRLLPTPDKPNAWMGSGLTLKLVDSAPEYPAMLLASEVLGGGASARLFAVLREKQGLTYGAYAGLRVDARNDRAMLMSNVTFAPQNLAAVEKGLAGELERWATVSKEELESRRKEVLDGRYQSRASDDELASDLASLSNLGRTMAWEGQLDEALKGTTAEQVNAAVKKLIDPANMVTVKAGDFKVVASPK